MHLISVEAEEEEHAGSDFLNDSECKRCWLETNTKPIGTNIDTNRGDGDRLEIRSRLVATELEGSLSQDGHLA